jgi:hypothetical protein
MLAPDRPNYVRYRTYNLISLYVCLRTDCRTAEAQLEHVKNPLLSACFCIGLAAASLPAGAAGLFSAKGVVIAILAGELYVGEAEGHLNGAGTLAIHSQRNPGTTCVGDFVSSASEGGAGKLHCNDGGQATFRFERLTMFRGHGSGRFSRGAMSFVYGLTATEAAPYLSLPAGKRLLQDGTALQLVDL